MTEEKVTQVKLCHGSVGIVGLPELLEKARNRAFGSDEEIKAFLVEEVKAKNFVARTAEADYAEALFREYKKFIGEALPEEDRGLLEVRILGPGCPRCRNLEEVTRAALAELDVAADLQHVTNLMEIAQYGILATPGLVINGEVKSSGRSLSKEQVKSLIAAELEGRARQ